MRFWLLIFVLATSLIGVTFYMRPHIVELMSANGELTAGIASGLFLLIIQLISTKVIVESAVDGMRNRAQGDATQVLKDDTHNIVGLYRNMQDEYTGIPTSTVDKIKERISTGEFGKSHLGVDSITIDAFLSALSSPSPTAQVTFLAHTLDIGQMRNFAAYVGRRAELNHCFQRVLGSPNVDLAMRALFDTNPLPPLKSQGDNLTALATFWFVDAFGAFLEIIETMNLHNQDYSGVIARLKSAHSRLEVHLDPSQEEIATEVA